MKRFLAIFLSLSFILSCLFGSFPSGAVSVGPTGTNLILGGDFANGTGYTTSTTLPAATDSFVTGLNYRTWYRATAQAGAIANNSDSYGNFLRAKQYGIQAVPFITGKTYTLRFDFRGTTGISTDQFRVFVADNASRSTPISIGSVSINSVSSATTTYMTFQKPTTWTRYLMTFKLNASLTAGHAYCLLFYDPDYNSTNQISFDLDNVELYDNDTIFSSSLVADGGFEYTQNMTTANSSASSTLPVIKQQAATTTPNNIWHQAQGNSTQFSRVTTEDAHSGSNSAIVNPYLHQGVTVSEGSTYRVEFWAKTRNYNKLACRFVSTDDRSTAINTEGTQSITLSSSWTKYSVALTMPDTVSGSTLLSFFTANSTDNYANYNANDVFIDEITMIPAYKISVSASTGGSASVSSSTAAPGEQVTFTATPNGGSNFLGWFVAGNTTPVSTSSSYTVAVNANLSLVAKFQTVQFGGEGNLVKDGDFTYTTSIPQAEDYSTVTYDSAHIWYQPPGSSAVITDSGNSYAKVNWIYQSAKIAANKNYLLTFKAKTTDPTAAISVVLRALKDRTYTLESAVAQPIASDGTWQTYTAMLQVTNLNPSYSDYILGIGRTSGTEAYVDDVIFAEFNNTANVGYIGAAIRTALTPPKYTQGLRFKASISHDVINGSVAYGYHVVEYGHIAIKTDYLGGQPLVLDGSYDYGGAIKTPKEGVAYNTKDGYDVVFSDDGTIKTYTAVLIGITDYNTDYTVRPYVIYENDSGEQVVCYGSQQTQSVYHIASLAYSAAGSNQGGFAESRPTRLALFTILNTCNSSVYTAFVENYADLPENQIP